MYYVFGGTVNGVDSLSVRWAFDGVVGYLALLVVGSFEGFVRWCAYGEGRLMEWEEVYSWPSVVLGRESGRQRV